MNVSYEVLLLHDRNISKDLINKTIDMLGKINIRVGEIKEINLDRFEYNAQRKQYNGKDILYSLTEENEQVIFVLISEDMYLPGLNYVIGLFRKNDGVLISTYRIKHDAKLLEKKILHEAGHLMGLEHCTNYCIMRYAESTDEIAKLPDEFCFTCRKKLGI